MKCGIQGQVVPLYSRESWNEPPSSYNSEVRNYSLTAECGLRYTLRVRRGRVSVCALIVENIGAVK